jgi:hypothetical protein
VLMAGVNLDSALSGVIPAVGIVVGTAAVKLMSTRRKAAEQKDRDARTVDTTLEASVKEMTEFLGGTPATIFKPKQPGFVERFDGLEQKVDGHGVALAAIKDGIDKLAAGQEAAARAAVDTADLAVTTASGVKHVAEDTAAALKKDRAQ